MTNAIDQALGHSIVYEEQRNDLTVAQTLAEEGVRQARQRNDPPEIADALLAQGVVHLLQGEANAAAVCFQQSQDLTPSDVNRKLRAFSYGLLAEYEQFNEFFDGCGANSLEVSDRWGGLETRKAESATYQSLYNQANDPEAQFDAWFACEFLGALHTSRASLATAVYSPAPIVSADQILGLALGCTETLRHSQQSRSRLSLSALADFMAADLCHRAGQQDRAQEYLAHAMTTYTKASDDVGVAVCKMMEGDLVATTLGSPLGWNFAIQDSSTEGSNLAWQVEEQESSLNAEAAAGAKGAYDTAEFLFRQAGSKRGLGSIELRRGYLAMLNGDYSAAAEAAKRASGWFEVSGDKRGYQLARAHLGLCQIGLGEAEGVAEIARQIGKWGASGGSFTFTLSIGILFNEAGRHWLIRDGKYEQALACYRASRALFAALGATVNESQSLVDQAMTYGAVGERSAALKLYDDALDALEEALTKRPALAHQLRQRLIMLSSHVYNLYLEDRDADGMERSAHRVEKQSAALGGGDSTLAGLVAALSKSATTRPQSSGEKQGGLDFFADFALGQFAKEIQEQARVLIPLYRAMKARDTGSTADAERLFDQAMTAAQLHAGSDRGFLEATVLATRKRYSEAETAFDRYLGGGGAAAGLSGMIAQVAKLGKPGDKMFTVRTAKQALSFMIRIEAFGRCEEYIRTLEELAGEDWWRQEENPWSALSDCGLAYEGVGDLTRARLYYSRGIAELESRRKNLRREELKTALAGEKDAQALYFRAARCALKADDAVSAFDYSERAKGRALLDLMAASTLRVASDEGGEMRAWRENSQRITLFEGLVVQARAQKQPDAALIEYLTGQLAEAEKSQAGHEQNLAKANPDFYRAINPQANTLSLNDVKAAVPPEAVLLQYFFFDQDLLAWAITRTGETHVSRAIDSHELERKITALHSACENQGPIAQLSSQLSEILIEPFAETIRTSNRLLISPYGAAHLLPFHALPYGGQPLIATRAVSYLPSASSLQFLKPDSLPVAGFAQARMLAVGNPAQMSYQPPLAEKPILLSPLPAAESEVVFAVNLFPGSVSLIGEEARLEQVRKQISGRTLLHFATHGILSEEAPLASALALAHGDLLTVYELMGLRLDADLVVLSACETARGKTTGGDDILGLTRGLLAAGARCAVVSLWPVNDATTGLFMGEFYLQLREGKTPAMALKGAQNYLSGLSETKAQAALSKREAALRQWKVTTATPTPGAASGCEHPFYWAPFILIG